MKGNIMSDDGKEPGVEETAPSSPEPSEPSSEPEAS